MELNHDDILAVNREVLLAFWKVHILHHAAEEGVVGQWMLSELRRHGYDVSPGTLYPMLQRMETHGWLRSEVDSARGPKGPRTFYLTDKGRAVLRLIGAQLEELRRELAEGR